MSFERSGTRRDGEGACANGAAQSAAPTRTPKQLRKRPIPLTVVGGDFGAGKTTVLGALVAADPGNVAVMFYDTLGGAEVDATLLDARCCLSNVGAQCLCCTSHHELLDALARLRTATLPPQHVYIEVNGDCDPWMVFAGGMASGFDIRRSIVVADAQAVRRRARSGRAGLVVVRQLQGADLIVLNKVDLARDDARDLLRHWVRGLNPSARIVESWTDHPITSDALADACRALRIVRRPYDAVLRGASNSATAGAPAHQSWRLTSSEAFDGSALRAWLESLSGAGNLVRAKGVVHLREEADRRFVLQCVGAQWRLDPDIHWETDVAETKIVLVGGVGSTAIPLASAAAPRARDMDLRLA
jgi:G3E family GTPase